MQDREDPAGAVLEFAGHDTAEQCGAGAVVNFDFGDGTGESGIAVKDNDPVAGCASGELGCEPIGLRGGVLERFCGELAFGVVVAVVVVAVIRIAGVVIEGGLWKESERVSAISREPFAGGSAGSRFAGAFDEDAYVTADKFGIVFFGNAVLEFEHFVVATAFDVFGDVIRVEFVGFGTAAGAVFEDEAVFEAAVTDELHAFFEAVFGFAAEADNEVTGDGTVGHKFADSVHHFAVFFDGVTAFHAFEDIIAAGLSRDVEVLHDLWQIANGLQQIVGHIPGEIGDKADAFDTGDAVELFEEIGESNESAVFGVFVAVDCLSKERDFADPLIGQKPGFLEDVCGWTTLFGAACCRDHAVGTELIAADHNADEGLKRGGPHFGIPEWIPGLKAVGDFFAGAVFSSEADGFELCAGG